MNAAKWCSPRCCANPARTALRCRRCSPNSPPRWSLVAAGIDGLPRSLLADAGYFSADNVTAVTDTGIDPLIATGRQRRGEPTPAAPRGRIPTGLTPKQRMSRKLPTVKGKTDYARRKAIVEPVFGQLKVAQNAGQFRLRGQHKAQDEWTLHVFCHNLRKFKGSGWTPQTAI